MLLFKNMTRFAHKWHLGLAHRWSATKHMRKSNLQNRFHRVLGLLSQQQIPNPPSNCQPQSVGQLGCIPPTWQFHAENWHENQWICWYHLPFAFQNTNFWLENDNFCHQILFPRFPFEIGWLGKPKRKLNNATKRIAVLVLPRNIIPQTLCSHFTLWKDLHLVLHWSGLGVAPFYFLVSSVDCWRENCKSGLRNCALPFGLYLLTPNQRIVRSMRWFFF